MADREFVFGNPEVQKLIIGNFVPLAMDDWYLRRQPDENGRFYMAMTDQGPRGGSGTGTRQGRYAFTAAGKLLGFNNNRDPERILSMLRDALKKWEALPEAERRPAGEIGLVKPAPQYHRPLPEDGAVISVYTRVLENGPDGRLRACAAPENDGRFEHRGFGAAVDHLWLQKAEVGMLLPAANAAPGRPIPVPAVLALRLARFHLVDNTRGEPPFWEREHVRKLELFLTPESPGRATLSGSVHVETKDNGRGFTGTLTGRLEYRDTKLTALEAVVSGLHWGEGPYTAGARPGKTPIGFALRLCTDPKPADCIPPQAARWLQGYYEADRH